MEYYLSLNSPGIGIPTTYTKKADLLNMCLVLHILIQGKLQISLNIYFINRLFNVC